MRTRILSATALIALSMIGSTVSAETQSAGNDTETETVKTDQIFDHIMQSMPAELKTRLDSAAKATEQTRESTHNQGAQKGDTDARKAALGDALDELPKDLKEKVNKAMQKIDQQGEQRVLQFKERKRKRSAKQQ